ncbi:MAG: hypothetical protein DLM62_11720 [Pseudonocardiales bacterium]|nr:MAG: hypothetical protein DLM62_11720 [Pseudonocardiales bacterium]
MGAITAALAQVLRRGLPITAATADPVLLDLRGVISRAINADDAASRTSALDGVMRGLLARFPDARHAEAARALFGLPPAEPGQTLTVRRELAAGAAGHEVHHFRKRVEPRLIDKLAAALLADADRFTRSRVIAPRLAPSAGWQTVPADPFSWELAEHEEALTRLWAAIYAARAELLAVARLLSLGADRQQVVCQAVTAAWRWAQASLTAASYARAFGADINDVSAHDLVALAGWTPPMTDEQADRLRQAAAGEADRASFLAALHNEPELGASWVDAFADPDGQTSPLTTERLIS